MPLSSAATSASTWEPGTTVELVALVVTLPGAIATLATLWILLSRQRQKIKKIQSSQVTSTSSHTSRTHIGSESEIGLVHRFQEQYRVLRDEAVAERGQWAEELSDLERRRERTKRMLVAGA